MDYEEKRKPINPMQRPKVIQESGEWWTISWWRDDVYYENRQFTKAEADTAFGKLKEIYDANWMIVQANESVRHPIYQELCMEGRSGFDYLVRLGLNIYAVESGFLDWRSTGRLRETGEYLGIAFELDILAHLLRQNFEVKREVPSNNASRKKADFQVIKGSETLFVEVKHLKFSEMSDSISDIAFHIYAYIMMDPSIHSIPHVLNLELGREILDCARTKAGLDSMRSSWQCIAEAIRDDVSKNLSQQAWGGHSLPGLAKYFIYPREQGGEAGSFQGLFTSSQKKEVKRIFKNLVSDAIEQLPQHTAGLVIVRVPLPLDIEFAKVSFIARFHKNPKRYHHLSGVMLAFYCYSCFVGKNVYNLGFIQNPFADIDISEFAAVKSILSLNG